MEPMKLYEQWLKDYADDAETVADLMSIKEAMGHKSLSSTTVYLTLGIGNGRSVKSPYDD